MPEVEYRDDVTVELIDNMGDEISIVRAARVSTKGSESKESENSPGLINFLYREKHGVPFESCILQFYFEIPIFVSRQIVKHRLCLAGETKVHRVFKNGISYGNVNNTLETIWENWHLGVPDRRIKKNGGVRRRKLDVCKEIYVRSFDEQGNATISKVLEVNKGEPKGIYTLTTAKGKTLRCSIDHKINTPDGWKSLRDLNVGDYVLREGLIAANSNPNEVPRLRQAIGLWTQRQRDILIPYNGAKCTSCGKFFEKNELELDHEIPVVVDISKALDINNLKPKCKKCHRLKTNNEQNIGYNSDLPKSKKGLRPDKIVNISEPVDEVNYDLVLEGNPNFIANGISVHNSSINETSGRYRELQPVFYVPNEERKLSQIGKTGDYNFQQGNLEQYAGVKFVLENTSKNSWENYEKLLEIGVAKEVARMHLPLNIYTSMYFTANLRSVLNFLSLRKNWGEEATHQSKAQTEVEMVAEKVAKIVKELYPTVWKCFIENGYEAV